MTRGDPELDELLRAAREASPNDRIELRDDLARLGVAAIDAVSDWLLDPELSRFALRVIGRAGQFGEHDAAIRALVAGREVTPPPIQADIDLEMGRLDYTPPKPRKPSTPSWAKTNPYDVAPLSAQGGLSWPGFQPHDFEGIAGTSWRRRDDPISMPPLITRRLRTLHPHFSSWDISRSPAVHFAVTDRYRQFDDPESGWRAAKLVIYAVGPTEELPGTPRQVVAGLYVEKGDGSDPYGPVDARWDWPRFVASLTEPEINTRLTSAMEKHGLQLGDFFSQRFLLPTEPGIGGTGKIENGVLVFRSAQAEELFRGWEALRHHLEQLSEEEWHNLHIWRSWTAEEAIDAGPTFAGDAIAPVLLDLGATYLEIVKDAIAAGIHALHRVVERRLDRDGTLNDVVSLVQAHRQGGHFTVPQQVMDDFGFGPDARIHLVVETLEGARYFAGDVQTKSRNEVYYRVSDDETEGLQQIGPMEWIRITVGRPSRDRTQQRSGS
jgi:hypothetical protein